MSSSGIQYLHKQVTTNTNGNVGPVAGFSQIAVQVFRDAGAAGTHTVTFQGSVDGVNYVNLGLFPLATPTASVATATGAGVQGIWSGSIAGLRFFRCVVANIGVDTLSVSYHATTT